MLDVGIHIEPIRVSRAVAAKARRRVPSAAPAQNVGRRLGSLVYDEGPVRAGWCAWRPLPKKRVALQLDSVHKGAASPRPASPPPPSASAEAPAEVPASVEPHERAARRSRAHHRHSSRRKTKIPTLSTLKRYTLVRLTALCAKYRITYRTKAITCPELLKKMQEVNVA